MFDFPSRGVARSTRAIVASPNALASSVGLDVLRRGGNAVDAAIATNAVLTATYVPSCGIGGDSFWVVYEPRTREVLSYNGSGRAPAAANARSLRERGWKKLPDRAPECITVPGAVRSWEDLAARHGTRGLDELLEPAEHFARDGFACTDVVANYFKINAEWLRTRAEATRVFGLDRGLPQPGDVIRNPELAQTFADIRTGGADEFYGGRFGRAWVATLGGLGIAAGLDDLTAHRTERTVPVRSAWHGRELISHPPNSQGATTNMMMNILAGDGTCDEPLWNHLAIESVKLAYRERDRFFCDPHVHDVPLAEFLSPGWAQTARRAIDEDRAWIPAKSAVDRGDTIYLCVVDGEGRCVSLIQSLYMNFGSGYMAEGTGVFLHNRGAHFSLEPGHPNEFMGGKRPLHTLSPGMVLENGEPVLVYGSMGGDGQPQTQIQILHNYFERGMNVQQSLDAPRWTYGRSTDEALSTTVHVESRMAQNVRAALVAKGHPVAIMGPYENQMGHSNAIAIDRERGTLAGGADPRADSAALGL